MSNGPLSSTAVAMTTAASFALGATPLAYLVGVILVLVWINTPYRFSKRLASAGGMYYYSTKGAGATAGYLAGLSYIVYYTTIITANILFFVLLVPYVLAYAGIHISSSMWVAILVIMGMFSLIITLFKINRSLQYAFVTTVIEIVVLVAVSLIIVTSPAVHNTFAVYNYKLASNGISGFGVGMLVAAFGMSGSTASVYLGSEARIPHKTIKKALLASTLAILLMYVLVSYAFIVGWGYTRIPSYVTATVPGLELIQRFTGILPAAIIGILMINSIVGVDVAGTIVASRVEATYAAAGIFPSFFGRTTKKNKVPYGAIVFTTVAAIVLGIYLGIVLGITTGFIFGILLATMGEFLGHLIGNFALPLYERKVHTFRWFASLILPIASIVTILFGVFYTFVPVVFPYIYAPVGVVCVLILGAIHIQIHNRRHAEGLNKYMRAVDAVGEEVV